MCVIPAPLYTDERLLTVFQELQGKLETREVKVTITTKEPFEIQRQDWVLIPCINSSRVGSDAAVAFNTAGLQGEGNSCLITVMYQSELSDTS